MSATSPVTHCEVLLQLQSELEAMALALRKANDILNRVAESPDTLRRRRNSIKRWNEVYGIAHDRLTAHRREHKCGPQSDVVEA
jgi:hypothetical protein